MMVGVGLGIWLAGEDLNPDLLMTAGAMADCGEVGAFMLNSTVACTV